MIGTKPAPHAPALPIVQMTTTNYINRALSARQPHSCSGHGTLCHASPPYSHSALHTTNATCIAGPNLKGMTLCSLPHQHGSSKSYAQLMTILKEGAAARTTAHTHTHKQTVSSISPSLHQTCFSLTSPLSSMHSISSAQLKAA